jgi:HEAT repeat protein
MKNLFFGCLTVVLLGSSSRVFGADPQSPDAYLVRASSQTIKRRQAVLVLAQSKNQAGAPELVAALADKDPMSRSLAAQGLGTLKYAAARPELAKLLAADPYPEVREAAAVSLRQIEDPSAVDALSQALGDSSANVRVTALTGLAHYRDMKSTLFVEAACKDKAVEVRRTAVFVLGRLEDPTAIPTVEQLLKDPDAAVRAGAAQTLAELHATGSKAVLLPLLKDPEKSVQASAARSLLIFGDNSGFETAKALAQDQDLGVRIIAVDALGWSKDPGAETELQSLLTEAPANIRPAVQEALTRTQQLRKQ